MDVVMCVLLILEAVRLSSALQGVKENSTEENQRSLEEFRDSSGYKALCAKNVTLLKRFERRKRAIVTDENLNLKWKPWTGSLPPGAVSIYNAYTKRRDYVCSARCSPGYFTKSKGQYCFYSLSDKELYSETFKVLVNEDDYEVLEWKYGSWGSVPPSGVTICETVYVGKHKYGLGKVVPNFKSFFLPYDGKEYFYLSYEVLTINLDYIKQTLNNVEYQLDGLNMTSQPPEILTRSKVINNDCRPVKKTISLSKASTTQNNWSIGRSITSGVSTIFTTGVPIIGEASFSFSTEISVDWNKGASHEETKTYQQTVQMDVPPNHICEAIMEGKRIMTELPFVASLTKYYRDGQKRNITVKGIYKGIQINELTANVKRCQTIPNPIPCPTTKGPY
ncbi:natterin-3-like [Discoglossus pictus]